MIDLHTHSTASDGSCTPERVIALALEAGLSALALTDHDTLDGIDRARAAAAGTGLRFLAGVEIEIASGDENAPEEMRVFDAPEEMRVFDAPGEFHLLGLGLSPQRDGLELALEAVRASRAAKKLPHGGALPR